MALTEIWLNLREQFEGKTIEQIIVFSGNGLIRDNSEASQEFRDFIRHIPSNLLQRYAVQCLNQSFKDSGFVLQDIINEVGRRLGFNVTYGRYRGIAGKNGYDGLWELTGKQSLIIEVKTSDVFRIDLDVIAKYRRELISQEQIKENSSSILIVVGREDTGDLEAQIRGSRHAWDVRLISVDALIRLMTVLHP